MIEQLTEELNKHLTEMNLMAGRRMDTHPDDIPKYQLNHRGTLTGFFVDGRYITGNANWWEFYRRIGNTDEYNTIAAIVKSGKSYSVGYSMTVAEYIKSHTSKLNEIQRLLCHLAEKFPLMRFTHRSARLEYQAEKRGEFIELSLPHHDYGGEKYWAVYDGKKLLVSVD